LRDARISLECISQYRVSQKNLSISVKSQLRDSVVAIERAKAMKRPDAGSSHDPIENAQARLRRIDVRVALAEERERRRIARGLHDEVGQVLALVQGKLSELKGTDISPRRAQEIELLRGLISDTILATRALTFELASPALYELGLGPALRSLGQELLARHGVRFHLEVQNEQKRVPEEDALVILYRCSRELLRNVLDHAQASNVWMRLTMRPHEIALSVEDDGVGFEPLKCSAAFGPGGHYGLQSVREQLAGLGGRFKIAASPGSGTRIMMAIPTHPGNEELRAYSWARGRRGGVKVRGQS
jgi:signal transduction histidine kinase